MYFRNRVLLAVVIIASAICWAVPVFSADGSGKFSIRFPAFSLSPGERIAGVQLKVSEGRIYSGCKPNRWTCDRDGTSIHCYSLHPQYATAISGMLPEFIVRNVAGASLSIDASVEFIDNDGKEYSRDIRQDELIIR